MIIGNAALRNSTGYYFAVLKTVEGGTYTLHEEGESDPGRSLNLYADAI